MGSHELAFHADVPRRLAVAAVCNKCPVTQLADRAYLDRHHAPRVDPDKLGVSHANPHACEQCGWLERCLSINENTIRGARIVDYQLVTPVPFEERVYDRDRVIFFDLDVTLSTSAYCNNGYGPALGSKIAKHIGLRSPYQMQTGRVIPS